MVLVPSYRQGDPRRLKKAMEAFKVALPNWRVVSLDASDLIVDNGALHCIAMGLYKFNQVRQLTEEEFPAVMREEAPGGEEEVPGDADGAAEINEDAK